MSGLEQDYSHFRHLHPLTILHGAIVYLPQLFIPVYLAFFQKDASEWMYLVFLGIYTFATLPFILLKYYYFTFAITPKELIIHSGIIARKQRNIPIEKIQNVETTQNLLQRLLGLSKVMVETAGDAATEGVLEFVSKSDAAIISKTIKSYQNQIIRQAKGVSETSPTGFQTQFHEQEPQKLFSMSIRELFIFGLLRLRPSVLFIIFWFVSIVQQFMVLPQTEQIDFKKYQHYLQSLDFFSFIGFILLTLLIAFIISWFFDILLTINTFYGFNLSIDGNKLLTKQGLFNKKAITIPLKKLQMITIATNPIRKKLGYYGLYFETAGFAGKYKGPELAVPFAKLDRVLELAKGIKPFNLPETFIPISKKAIQRAFIRYLVLLLPFAVIGIILLPKLLYLLIFLPLFYLGAYLRWQYRGYFLSHDYVIIKQGFWNQKISIIPIEKLQTLNIFEALFQRPFRLATLNIDTAAGFSANAHISDIDSADAKNIMDELWMAFSKRVAI